jgi:hypothetical protein
MFVTVAKLIPKAMQDEVVSQLVLAGVADGRTHR